MNNSTSVVTITNANYLIIAYLHDMDNQQLIHNPWQLHLDHSSSWIIFKLSNGLKIKLTYLYRFFRLAAPELVKVSSRSATEVLFSIPEPSQDLAPIYFHPEAKQNPFNSIITNLPSNLLSVKLISLWENELLGSKQVWLASSVVLHQKCNVNVRTYKGVNISKNIQITYCLGVNVKTFLHLNIGCV